MAFLQRLFGNRSPWAQSPSAEEQVVLVYLDGTSLPGETYEQFDVATLEDSLTGVIERHALGVYDGHEFGPTEVTLFMYGPDAERLFAGIEPTLRGYPLCANARVVIRSGAPGAPERELIL